MLRSQYQIKMKIAISIRHCEELGDVAISFSKNFLKKKIK